MNDGLLRSYAVFSLTASTDDLDERFTRLLDGLNLDTVGGLVEMFSAQGELAAPARACQSLTLAQNFLMSS